MQQRLLRGDQVLEVKQVVASILVGDTDQGNAVGLGWVPAGGISDESPTHLYRVLWTLLKCHIS